MAIKKVSQLNPLPFDKWYLTSVRSVIPPERTYDNYQLSCINSEYVDKSLIELSHFVKEENESNYWLSYQTTLGDFKSMIGLSGMMYRLDQLSSFWSEGTSTYISGTFIIGNPNHSWKCSNRYNSADQGHTVLDDNSSLDRLSVLVPYEFTNEHGGIFHGPVKIHNGLTADNGVLFTGSLTCDNPIHGVALTACWADVAEVYEADDNYSPGTLVMFGGEKEITVASHHANAVVTSNPGLLLNKGEEKTAGTGITLAGRVPVKVIGPVEKFDKIVLSATPGVGIAVKTTAGLPDYLISNRVIGRALASSDDVGIKLVECVVNMNLE